MTVAWSAEELERLSQADELQIAARRVDGSLRRWVTIWAVCSGGQVYVRTWYRRDSGWFAHVLDARRARIRVPGLELDVLIADVGASTAQLHAHVDDAYRKKYALTGREAVDRMVTLDAAATTLQLFPTQSRLGAQRSTSPLPTGSSPLP